MWCLRRKGEALRLVDRLGAKGLQMPHAARCIRVVAQVQAPQTCDCFHFIFHYPYIVGLNRGYIGIMENTKETTIWSHIIIGYTHTSKPWSFFTLIEQQTAPSSALFNVWCMQHSVPKCIIITIIYYNLPLYALLHHDIL